MQTQSWMDEAHSDWFTYRVYYYTEYEWFATYSVLIFMCAAGVSTTAE